MGEEIVERKREEENNKEISQSKRENKEQIASEVSESLSKTDIGREGVGGGCGGEGNEKHAACERVQR